MFRKVLKFMSKNNVSKKVERVICDNCNGDGVIGEKSCPVCKGTGDAASAVEAAQVENEATEDVAVTPDGVEGVE